MSNADYSRRKFLATTVAAFGGALVGKPVSATGAENARTDGHQATKADATKPLRVCLISGSLEYKSDESLGEYQKYLEEKYPVRCTRAFRRADDDLPGLESLDDSDVMLLFTRRMTIAGKQLDRIKEYCAAGRPIVGVRTASHAFQNWLELDKGILGGNYRSHYPEGPTTKITIAESAKGHPILEGFVPYESVGSLYRNAPIASDTTTLLIGEIPRHVEPIAWTRTHRGGRVFYTSLGHPADFEVESFRRMVAQALLWTTKRIG